MPSHAFVRRWTMRLALILASIGVTLLAVEMVVRAVPLYPDTFTMYDPARGWRYEPGKTGAYLNIACLGEFRTKIAINSQGLRDVEHPYDPPPDTRRILIVGDSMTAAFEVPLEQTFFRRLEEELNAMPEGSPRYEVVGAGYQGYGTDMEVLFYEAEGYRYQPDLVLLVFQPHNDINDNHPALRIVGPDYFPYFSLDESGKLVFHHPAEFSAAVPPSPPSINPLHDTLYRLSDLYRLIYDRHQYIQRRAERFRSVEPDPADLAATEEAWAITRALVARLRDDAQAGGARFAVAIAEGYFPNATIQKNTHAKTQAMLDDLGIPYLDLLPVFQAAASPEKPLRLPCDTHWTSAGHEVVAGALLPFVQFLMGGE